METMVYRKGSAASLAAKNGTHRVQSVMKDAISSGATEELMGWHPEIFYPVISKEEEDIWTHWLPTTLTYNQVSAGFPYGIMHTLTQLKAPQEVLDEFAWAYKMDLFETYDIKTPERQDQKDPLLIGQHEGKRYRIALWGESLRPVAEITELVAKSLALRDRTAWWQKRIIAGGTLCGLGLGLYLGSQPSFEGDPISLGFALALFGLASTWLCTWCYTPENRQQTFLDRYRC
jgi:hypothetical protein